MSQLQLSVQPRPLRLVKFVVKNKTDVAVVVLGVNAAHALSQYQDKVRACVRSNAMPSDYRAVSVTPA